MAQHYAQRASAGLIIAEGTNISPQARGYANTPGLYDAMHRWRGGCPSRRQCIARGGHIFVQLWHVGRISHPSLQPGGAVPVAPSALRAEGLVPSRRMATQACVTPRPLSLEEIPALIEDYRRAAAKCARGGIRRRRNPCRRWLSARAIPARQYQPSDRSNTAARQANRARLLFGGHASRRGGLRR